MSSQICFGVLFGLSLGKSEKTFYISDVSAGNSTILRATCCPRDRVELACINLFKNCNFGVYALYLYIGELILKKPSRLIPESDRGKRT